jgi:putative membrane protein
MALTEHLANERTFLAWLRTALAVLAFGFVLERMSLYMQYVLNVPLPPHETAYAASLGRGMIWMGTGLIPLALWRYLDEAKNIDRGLPTRYRIWPVVLLAAIFVAIGLYLSLALL